MAREISWLYPRKYESHVITKPSKSLCRYCSNQNEYKLIKEQLSREEQQKVYASGYLYDMYKRNHYSKNVLTLTNSDQIYVETLIRLHKDYQFHIGAKTEMSSKLLSLSQYENVKLYPIIKDQTVQTLYQQCDIYLDINEGMK